MAADPLASLKDIHLPPPISAWPPAPGWIILACLLFAGLLYLAYHLRRHYANQRLKREALGLIDDAMHHHLQNDEPEQTCTLINTLLKRVALLYYPREQIAELHGQAWIEFLNRTGKKIDFNPVASYLTTVLYQKPRGGDARNDDMLILLTLTKKWIKQQRGAPCST